MKCPKCNTEMEASTLDQIANYGVWAAGFATRFAVTCGAGILGNIGESFRRPVNAVISKATNGAVDIKYTCPKCGHSMKVNEKAFE